MVEIWLRRKPCWLLIGISHCKAVNISLKWALRAIRIKSIRKYTQTDNSNDDANATERKKHPTERWTLILWERNKHCAGVGMCVDRYGSRWLKYDVRSPKVPLVFESWLIFFWVQKILAVHSNPHQWKENPFRKMVILDSWHWTRPINVFAHTSPCTVQWYTRINQDLWLWYRFINDKTAYTYSLTWLKTRKKSVFFFQLIEENAKYAYANHSFCIKLTLIVPIPNFDPFQAEFSNFDLFHSNDSCSNFRPE